MRRLPWALVGGAVLLWVASTVGQCSMPTAPPPPAVVRFRQLRVELENPSDEPVDAAFLELVARTEGNPRHLHATSCVPKDAPPDKAAGDCAWDEVTGASIRAGGAPQGGSGASGLGLSSLSWEDVLRVDCSHLVLTLETGRIVFAPGKQGCTLPFRFRLRHPAELSLNAGSELRSATTVGAAAVSWTTSSPLKLAVEPAARPAKPILAPANLRTAKRLAGTLAEDLRFAGPGRQVCESHGGHRVSLNRDSWDFQALHLDGDGYYALALGRKYESTAGRPWYSLLFAGFSAWVDEPEASPLAACAQSFAEMGLCAQAQSACAEPYPTWSAILDSAQVIAGLLGGLVGFGAFVVAWGSGAPVVPPGQTSTNPSAPAAGGAPQQRNTSAPPAGKPTRKKKNGPGASGHP